MKSVQKTRKLEDFGLDERQYSLVNNYIHGMTQTEATLAAGYGGNQVTQAFRAANVQLAIGAMLEQFLHKELAPAAMRRIGKLLKDDKTPPGVAGSVALGVLDRAGFSAKRYEKSEGSGKDIAQMNSGELQAEIERLSREIDNRMRDVTPVSAPHSEPVTSQELDMYE